MKIMLHKFMRIIFEYTGKHIILAKIKITLFFSTMFKFDILVNFLYIIAARAAPSYKI